MESPIGVLSGICGTFWPLRFATRSPVKFAHAQWAGASHGEVPAPTWSYIDGCPVPHGSTYRKRPPEACASGAMRRLEALHNSCPFHSVLRLVFCPGSESWLRTLIICNTCLTEADRHNFPAWEAVGCDAVVPLPQHAGLGGATRTPAADPSE